MVVPTVPKLPPQLSHLRAAGTIRYPAQRRVERFIGGQNLPPVALRLTRLSHFLGHADQQMDPGMELVDFAVLMEPPADDQDRPDQ